ncbi:MAG: hypothetical protein RLY16_967 [Bacteroidota bacterium]
MYKIPNSTLINIFLIFIFFSLSFQMAAQDSIPLNKYQLPVVSSIACYQFCISQQPAGRLLDVKQKIKNIQLDLRYATSNNFMHQALYEPLKTTYLTAAALFKLDSVQQDLKPLGLGLKIFDAYRPYAVTEAMWELVKDDRYAADPRTGSGHNRGVAVDLTLINLKTGKELAMGTDFDNFSDTAHHTFVDLPVTVLNNRQLLKTTMEKFGFKALSTEWWHYSLLNAKEFPILNIAFAELKRFNRQ